jgi:ribosomal protein S27AE
VKYRKKSSLTEATQWFKNGDHPQDESTPIDSSDESSKLSEGKVVKYFRELDALASLDALSLLNAKNQFCPECGNLMQRHGVFDGEDGEEYVCPGDYIVTHRNGAYYRLSRGEFESQYELYARPPHRSPTEEPLSDLEELRLRRKADPVFAREMRRKSPPDEEK